MYPSEPELKTYQESPQPMTTSITGPVVVPALQAGITGILTGLTAGILTAAAAPELQLAISPIAAAAITGSATTLASWLTYRGRWQWIIERALGIDLDQDGYIGQPEPPPQPGPLRVEVIQDNGHRSSYIDLPYPEKLPRLAEGLLAGRQFTQTIWTGHGAVFSRSEFDQLRSEMLRRGLATWRNSEHPAQGVELTAAGRAVMRRLVDHQRESQSPALPPWQTH